MLRSFILRGMFFLIGILAILLALNALTDRGLRKTEADTYLVWNQLFSGQASADILIMGNSHASAQVDPLIIEQDLGSSAYNIGLDGQNFDLQLMRYQAYRHYNRKPKVIIQIIDFSTLEASTKLFNRSQYLPYLQDSSIYKTLRPLGISFWDKYLPVLKYRGLLPVLRLGLSEESGLQHERSTRVKGFLARTDYWTTEMDEQLQQTPDYFLAQGYTPAIGALAKQFLADNKRAQITTIVVAAPQFHDYNAHFPNRRFYWACIEQEVRRNGGYFLNYQEDSLSEQKQYFSNPTHLNQQGAALFSKKLAAGIRMLLHSK